MNYLLDTHARTECVPRLYRMVTGRCGAFPSTSWSMRDSRTACHASPRVSFVTRPTKIQVSSVSLWEISLKYGIGKLLLGSIAPRLATRGPGPQGRRCYPRIGMVRSCPLRDLGVPDHPTRPGRRVYVPHVAQAGRTPRPLRSNAGASVHPQASEPGHLRYPFGWLRAVPPRGASHGGVTRTW